MKKYMLIFLSLLILYCATVIPADTAEVTLRWTNSPSEGVAGYNLYRREYGSKDWVLVNSAVIPADSSGVGEYTDSRVVAGKRYFWTCRAAAEWSDPYTGESGVIESADSNEATKFIKPGTPQPPVNLIEKILQALGIIHGNRVSR